MPLDDVLVGTSVVSVVVCVVVVVVLLLTFDSLTHVVSQVSLSRNWLAGLAERQLIWGLQRLSSLEKYLNKSTICYNVPGF